MRFGKQEWELDETPFNKLKVGDRVKSITRFNAQVDEYPNGVRSVNGILFHKGNNMSHTYLDNDPNKPLLLEGFGPGDGQVSLYRAATKYKRRRTVFGLRVLRRDLNCLNNCRSK